MKPALGVLAALCIAGCDPEILSVQDQRTRDAGASFPELEVPIGTPVEELGRNLFFDPILSGNRDVACATCHIVFVQTVEPLPISIGTGGVGIGPTRQRGAARELMARNASDLFHRGNVATTNVFWDGRLERLQDGSIRAPIALPAGVTDLLVAQALLPLVTPEEMRGHAGESPFGDLENEEVFGEIMHRLFSEPEYVAMFHSAFPAELGSLNITHVARALAAFQRALWDDFDAPFDFGGIVEGSDEALGRDIFFGKGRCSTCHSGSLFTDQSFHNIGVPQLGPGKDPITHFDEGRMLVTGLSEDRFAFRTPSLRNVTMTAPYMHNGAYATLGDAIRHHLHPEASLRAYTGRQDLPPSLASTVRTDEASIDAILATLDEDVVPLEPLTEEEVGSLIVFLRTLESTKEHDVNVFTAAPSSLPGGFVPTVWPLGTPRPPLF